MAIGPGKYDDACTAAREATKADAVVLVVLNGKRGAGFSVQSKWPVPPPVLADLLQHVVDTLRKDLGP